MAFWEAVATFFKNAKVAWETADALQKISYVFSAVTAVVGVKGYLQARQMLAKGQDILANKTSAGGKIPVIYGTRRVGAQVVYMDVSNNDSRHLFVVYALSVGEVDEILGKTIQLDGNPLTDSARFRYGCYVGSDNDSSLNTVSQIGSTISAGAGGFGTSPTSRYRITFNLHHGAATQTADPMLVASMPNWTSAHKLNGIAYIAAHYKYDKEGMFAGVPQLTVQVRGKKVYDPRDSGQTFGSVSTYEYSSNPALCFLDFITNNEYGKGLTQSQINMSTFSSAADVCDTEVDNPFFGGVSKSLTWSGNSGDGFITIGGSDPNNDWWQNKIGELIDIYDNNGDGVITGKEITDIQRDEFYDQNPLYRVYFNDTLGTNYSSQSTGSSLVKIKRFHCNGYLDTNKNVMDNAKELLANMRGIFLYIDGKYELQIEDTGTSTFTITDDHIIADAGISVDYGNKDKKANKVIVEFFNANKRYELDTATAFHDATPEYYSDDNDEILEIKAEFPYVTDPYIAYNMAKAILVRSRKQMTIQFLGTPEMYKLNVGDIVTLNYVGTFDTSQTCRVEALELQPNGLVAVSLIEYFDVYTWETPPEEPLEELANLPSAYAVKAPTGLSFTDTDSSSTGRPFLSWDEPTDFPDYQYRVNVVDSSSNQVLNRIVDVENCDLNFIPVNANYVASVTSLNTLGTESDPATLPFTVGDAPTGTPDIKNDAITTPKILDNNVTDAKIQSLTADKITAGTIDASVITVTNLDADNITSGTIGADKIDVTNLSAISADLGSITAGSIDIGSGTFSVTSAGLLDATGATINGEFVAGSGSNIFTADADGIYLGNATFANAPFKVLSSGEVQTTKSFTAGVAGTDEIAKMSGTGDYRFWSGSETPSNASFSVDKDGKAIAKNLVLKLTDGTVYFDSETGFSSSAISQISTSTGTKVSTVSSTFDADTEYEEITVTSTTSVNVDVSIDANFGGAYGNATLNTAIDESEQKVPENFTLTIEHSSDGGSTYNTVVTDTFTRVNDRLNPKTTPLSDEYKINTSIQEIFISGGGGVIYLATTTTSLNLGCVDSDGRTTLSYTGLSLSGTTAGTTHRIRASVSTTDTNYDTTNNNVSSTTPRVLSVTDPSGDGFYIDNGGGSTVPPEGDITAVQITTASSSGLTGGANFTSGDASFTLALASSIDGAKTFTNNVVIQGNLDVQGTTTTIDTTNLDVKDKNITLNYGTGDTSANANGAGITIQDAVSVGNDATLTWNTSDDSFNFSHPLNVTGTVTADGLTVDGDTTINRAILSSTGSDPAIEISARTDTSNLDFKFIDNDGSVIVNQVHHKSEYYATDGTQVSAKVRTEYADVNGGMNYVISTSGQNVAVTDRLKIASNGDISFYEDTGTTAKFFWDASAESLGIGNTSPTSALDVTGNVTATAFYGDGSNLTNITTTTINNNADNRIITGSGTANTLNAESTLTYDGTTLKNDRANGSGSVVGIQLTAGSSIGDNISLDFGSTTANAFSLQYDHYQDRLNLLDAGSNVFYVSGGVVNFTTAPVFGGGLTVPSLTVTGNGTIQTGAAGLIKGGYYQVGSTTVIDSSRNFINSLSIANNLTGVDYSGIMYDSRSGTAQTNFSSNALTYGSDKADIVIERRHSSTKDSLLGYAASLIDLRGNNTDNSWSLAHIIGVVDPEGGSNYQGGLIFSTSSGGTSSPTGRRTQGAAPTARMLIGATGNVRILTGGLYMGSNEVIDSSRNLTNIGSISATDLLTQNNTTIATLGARDLVTVGSGVRGGALKINDLAGANYYIAAGGYDLTFYKNVSGTSNTAVMRFEGATASDNTPDVRIINNLIVDGTISSGAITSTGTVTATNYYINDTNTRLHEGVGNALRIQTGTGYVDLGSMNSSWVHFQANKNIYILPSTHVSIDGHLYPYTDSTRTLGGNTVRWSHTYTDNITVTDNVTIGGTISSGAITSSGTSTFSTAISAGTTANTDTLHLYKYQADHGIRIQGSSSNWYFYNKYSDSGNLHITNNGSADITIDSSGNITNIGTISSGAITSSGKIETSGLRLGNALYAQAIDSKANYLLLQRDQLVPIEIWGSHIESRTTHYFGGSNANAEANIDTSGNFTTTGTISSGAITSSGTLSLGSYFQAGTSVSAGFYQDSANGAYRAIGTSSTRGFYFQSNAGANTYMYVGLTGTYAGRVGVGTAFPAEQFHATGVARVGSLKIGTTNVIDSARNLTNIASANIGGGTSYFSEKLLVSGRTRVAGQLDIAAGSGYSNYGTLNHDDSNFIIGVNRTSGNGDINLAPYGNVNITNGGLEINGTTVINSSRNLTNIGTISVGQASNTLNSNIEVLGSDATIQVHYSGQSRGGIGAFSTQRVGVYSTSPNDDLIFGYTTTGAGANFVTRVTIDNGVGSITASGNVTAYSDERLKDNIETLDGKKALQMRGVSFTKDGKEGSGVIAQELEKIAPELVLTANDEMGTKSVAYGNLVGYLIEAIKDQQKQIDELKARLDNDSSK